MTCEHELTFRSMGSEVRLLIGPRLLLSAPSQAFAAERERAYVEQFASRLSRFRPDSELSALNRDPRSVVPASRLLRTAVRAGLWAAERSGGLVDPTLLQAIQRAGYEDSLEGHVPASLGHALQAAPPRRPARPHRLQRWREITVDDSAGTVRRPPGVEIDTGGVGKGLCADAVARRLGHYTRFVVDCGGDIAIGGIGAQLDPYEVEVEHPLTGETIRSVRVRSGGIATSGLNVRLWRNHQGEFAHHLLDPCSGRPAWTGLIGVTAVAPSAIEAETLSKMALLSGPLAARRVLAPHGGMVVHDDGAVEQIGPLEGPRRYIRTAAAGHPRSAA
jgi:thiamine biosynthesis lipoprotein